MRTKSTIDSSDAAEIEELCLGAASSNGAIVSIAIVDEAGMLLQFKRMEGVRPHTVELATRKARSAATAGVSTKLIDEALRAGKLSSVDAIGWGGVPIEVKDECVGAIGISGSTPQKDHEIAAMAATLFAERQRALPWPPSVEDSAPD